MTQKTTTVSTTFTNNNFLLFWAFWPRAFDLFDTAFLIAAAEQRRLKAQLDDDQTYQEQHPIKRRLEEVEEFIEVTEQHTARLLRRPVGDDKEERDPAITEARN